MINTRIRSRSGQLIITLVVDAQLLGDCLVVDLPASDITFEAQWRDGDSSGAQGAHVGIKADDAFGLTLETEPEVGHIAGVAAALDIDAADTAGAGAAGGDTGHFIRRAGREIDVHGAIGRPALFQQLADNAGTVSAGCFPMDVVALVVGLGQRDRGYAHQRGGQCAADGAGVGHRVADIGARVDA